MDIIDFHRPGMRLLQ